MSMKQPIKLSDIIMDWEEDCVFDPTNVLNEIQRASKLHQKYLKKYLYFKTLAKKLEHDLSTQRREKVEYYRGRSEKPFPVKIAVSETETYIESDSDYQSVDKALSEAHNAVFYTEKIIKQLEQRSWDLKNAMEFQKFISGG